MKKLILLVFTILSHNVYAGGYSNWAVPTQLEYVNDGILIHGAYGNPNGCGVADRIFISRANSGNEKF